MSGAVLLGAVLAAVGFTQLVRASPLAGLPYKPFTCRTCLSGWGALLYGLAWALGSGAPRANGVPAWAVLVSFGADELQLLGVGVGGAALVFGVLDRLAAPAARPRRAPRDLPPPPPFIDRPL